MSSNQHGFSLIEMLIALSIFSVILLSLNYVQFQNTQTTGNLYFEQVALNLIHDAYEQCFIQKMDSCSYSNEFLQTSAAKQLPKGEGTLINDAEKIHIEVSWLNQFGKKRDYFIMDV